jgi:biopolymer transport protein TolR
MTKDKRVFLGRMEIPVDEVETKLKANAKLQVDHEAYLHADTALSYGEVVKVMAAIKLAGGDKMGLITDPLE